MTKENFTYLSSNKTNSINAYKWIPEGDVKAILQVTHGMAEYIDRYDDFAKYLNEHNILVVGHDHLGHGGSVENPSGYGFFSEGDATQYLIDDMFTLTAMTKQEYPDIPYFIFGHSMGSFITRHYITKYSNSIDGAIICGTGHMPKAVLTAAKALAKSISTFKGWNHRSKMIDSMGFGGFNKGFDNPRTNVDWLSRDEEQVDKYIEDERNGFIFTLNGYYHLFNTCLKTQDKELLSKIRKDLPILLIAGDKDPVGENGKAVLAVSNQYKELGIKDVVCILYPEYRHEILNEIDNHIVYKDVLKWLESHIES